MSKIGEIESVIKVNKADGKDTAEEKQKVNKLVTKVSEVADELSSIKSEHVKRMDELERELQEETQKKFKFDSTNVSLPGDTMMDRLLKKADVSGLLLNDDQFSAVKSALKGYGADVKHDPNTCLLYTSPSPRDS